MIIEDRLAKGLVFYVPFHLCLDMDLGSKAFWTTVEWKNGHNQKWQTKPTVTNSNDQTCVKMRRCKSSQILKAAKRTVVKYLIFI